MKGLTQKALILTIGVVIMAGVSCHQSETPDTKKARLIASENMQLKRQLEQRDSEIERLTKQHDREIKKREDRIAKCLEEQRALEKQLQEDIQKKVEDVLANVMEENAKLREQVHDLKAQIEELKK